jgi:hypothetical protein
LNKLQKKYKPILIIVSLVILIGIIIALLLITRPTPIAVTNEYGLGLLWEEANTMNECAECHNSRDFHTCETCHDDHGAVELSGVRFFEVLELTGDVPDPAFVRVNEVLPDQENAGTHITLFEFLKQYGIDDFESVTFTTNDGGLTTIESQYLDETAMLVPYVDGVRFVTESVHSSTWLKGIIRITLVSKEKPLLIDGEATSIGRLLLGETVRLTVEGSDVMLTDKAGDTSHALVANWIEGARLTPLLANPSSEKIILTDTNDEMIEMTGSEIQDAVLAIVRDKITLILPERNRSAWPTNIVRIESK